VIFKGRFDLDISVFFGAESATSWHSLSSSTLFEVIMEFPFFWVTNNLEIGVRDDSRWIFTGLHEAGTVITLAGEHKQGPKSNYDFAKSTKKPAMQWEERSEPKIMAWATFQARLATVMQLFEEANGLSGMDILISFFNLGNW
jgi:hypothetical protein